MNMLVASPEWIERRNQIKIATQDAWEAAGQMDELMARINYVRVYNNNVKLLREIGAAVESSPLYGANKKSFTHLAAHEVEYLFSNINVRIDLLKSLRINDMTLTLKTVENLIQHNAQIDSNGDLQEYTKKLTEVIKASFSGKRKNKNVLLDKQSYAQKAEEKLNIKNFGSIVRVYKISGFDHLINEDKFFDAAPINPVKKATKNKVEIKPFPSLKTEAVSMIVNDEYEFYTKKILTPAVEKKVEEVKSEPFEVCTGLPLLEEMIVNEYGLNADMVLAVCNVQEYRDIRGALISRAAEFTEKCTDDNFDFINEDLKSNLVHAILHFEGIYTFEFNNVVADLEVYFNDVQIPAEENLPLVSEPAVVVAAETTPAEITPPAAEEKLPLKKDEPAVESTPAVTTPAAEPVEEILEEVSLDVRQAQRDAAELIDAQIVAADQYELEELPGEDWNLSGDSIQVDNVDGYSLCYRIAVNTFKAGGVRMSSGETKRVYVKDASYIMYKAAQDQKNKQRIQSAMMW